MATPSTTSGSHRLGYILGIVALLLLAGTAAGPGMTDLAAAVARQGGVVAVLAGLAAVGLWANRRHTADLETIRQRRMEQQQLAARYNAEVNRLKGSYSTHSERQRRTGDRQYLNIRRNYYNQLQALKRQWQQQGGGLRLTRIWRWIFTAGFVAIFLSGCFNMGVTFANEEEPAAMAQLMDSREWSADNLPMPHMQDHSLYVVNPDSILSPLVVDSINETLGRLDDVLGIESVMAIVGHIKDDDPVGMVRGIYDKYKVGRDDRGLVVVVGYLDHSYFIAPGRSLEADLTDAECNRLAQNYLIPGMRAEQPDSGMLYLARGIYALMSQKELPQMSALSSHTGDGTDEMRLALLSFLLLLAGWGAFTAFMGRKVGTAIGAASLVSNPFAAIMDDGHTSGGGGFGGFGGGGSSGGGGGGFGGGSWGGGGAGGRW